MVAARVVFRDADAGAEPAASMLAHMGAELNALYERLPGSLDSIPARPEQMRPPEGAFLVGEADGEPVACGGIKRLAPGLAEIKRMYVVPERRGAGVSRLLLEALEQRCSALGYERIRLDTGAEQPAARHLYESAGYESIPDYNGNPYAAHWFEKRL